MIILCCGDRDWKDKRTISWLLELVTRVAGESNVVVVHGAAYGADAMSAQVAIKLGAKVIGYSAKWGQYGKAAGPIRNALMLRKHKDISCVFAFHDNIGESRGTLDMIKKANAKGIPVVLIPSKGKRNG